MDQNLVKKTVEETLKAVKNDFNEDLYRACGLGKTGVTADRDKIEFRVILKIELELNNLNSILSRSAVTPV